MALLIPAWSFFKAKLILPVLNICNAETVAWYWYTASWLWAFESVFSLILTFVC